MSFPIVKSGELLSFVTSGSRGWARYYSESGPAFLRMTNLDHGSVSLDLRDIQRVRPPTATEGSRTRVQSGDILISITADVGMVALVPDGFEEAYINQHVALARPKETVSPAYLAWCLSSPSAKRQFKELQRGATKVGLGLDDIRSVDIPLPPLKEQRRIVAEIEKQFTRLDAGVAALRRVQANLKRYRASVIEDTLAVDWPKMQVSEIGEVVTGTTPKPSEDDNYGGYLPFITPADLNAGYHLDSATRHLSSKGAKFARPLPERSVLVTCIGATIGKTGLARFPCATNQQINAFIPHDMAVSAEWAFWMFSSPSGQRQIRENASATTLPILNKTRFGMLRMPVPPLEVQTQLVAEIERKLTIADVIQNTLVRSLTRADRLRLTILETAFTGRLIAT